MRIFETINEMRKWRLEQNCQVALVPTMGYLHDGHLSLIKKAKELCSICIVSIFVNPTQFAVHEDLDKYPRNLEKDIELLNSIGADALFCPSVQEMYQDSFDTWVDVGHMSTLLEGKARPVHFKGVATVVNKLLNIVTPNVVIFGQKDAQQAAIIRKMINDLNINVRMEVCPTVRLASGLAQSSRNAYLSESELKAASCIYNSLILAQKLFESGKRDSTSLKDAVRQMINCEKLALLEYVSIASLEDLSELNEIENEALLSLAVKIGQVRLIDNLILSV